MSCPIAFPIQSTMMYWTQVRGESLECHLAGNNVEAFSSRHFVPLIGGRRVDRVLPSVGLWR